MARVDQLEASGDQTADGAPRQTQASTLPLPLRYYLGGSAGLDDLPWRPLFGAQYVNLNIAGPGRGRLVRVPSGGKLPFHSHSGDEHVLVLSGGYGDVTGAYGRGDVAHADGSIAHEPVALDAEPCVCMAVNYGWLLPTRLLAPLGRLFAGRLG